jgi:hypothetical protein
MMAAGTTVVALGAMATMAVADDRSPTREIQDLLDHDSKVIAEGQLMERFVCDPQPAGITMEEIRRGVSCPTGQITYGAFKRVKGNDGEFVCVSFRGWACYPSQTSN